MGGHAQGEEALPRESAEVSDGPVGVAQDAARVTAFAAAVEEAPGAVLGQDVAGVSGTLSTRRFPRSCAPGLRARLILSAVITIKEPHPRLGLDRALEHVHDGTRSPIVEEELEAPRDAGAVRGHRRRPP